MYSALLLLTVFCGSTVSILCHQCVNTHGTNLIFTACNNNYCLYEQILTRDGQMSLKKTCLDTPNYTFNDGVTTQLVNQCIVRTTRDYTYTVKMCNSGNYCNSVCGAVLPAPPPAPVGPQRLRQCYECTNYNGEDCSTGMCQGLYCTYKRVLNGRSLTIEKGCTAEGCMRLEDGTTITDINTCETRTESSAGQGTVSTTAKFCNDRDYCNNYCTNPIPVPPRPTTLECVQCTSDNGNDCVGTVCSGKFCIYEYRVSPNGARRVVRGCAESVPIEYPDNTYTRTVNECEAKTLSDGTQYLVEVCDRGNFCASDCLNQPLLTTPHTPLFNPKVTCYQCSARGTSNCQTGQCSGQFCYYYRSVNTQTGELKVERGCSPSKELDFPDKTPTNAYMQCEFRSIGYTSYFVNTCDNTNYCDTLCQSHTLSPSVYTTTHSYNNGVRETSVAIAIIIHIFVFLKVYS